MIALKQKLCKCGKPAVKTPKGHLGKFCSDDCRIATRREHWRSQHVRKIKQLNCRKCSQLFETTGIQKYCESCRDKTCIVCQAKTGSRANTCSERCLRITKRRAFKSLDGIPVPCDFCGSIEILSGAVRKEYERIGKSFCDRNCRAGWTSHNLHLSNFSGVLDRNRFRLEQTLPERLKRQEEKELLRASTAKQEAEAKKRWKCCVWCDAGFCTDTGIVWCSTTCRSKSEHVRNNVQKPEFKTCDYCGKSKWVAMPREVEKKLCSKKCHRKAAKDRRSHWARCNGRCEYIDLGRLIKRDGKQCKGCGCETTRYNGSYRSSDASIDHIVALANGGTHTWDNVQVMCVLCNSYKSDSDTHPPGGKFEHV